MNPSNRQSITNLASDSNVFDSQINFESQVSCLLAAKTKAILAKARQSTLTQLPVSSNFLRSNDNFASAQNFSASKENLETQIASIFAAKTKAILATARQSTLKKTPSLTSQNLRPSSDIFALHQVFPVSKENFGG
jgi:hypothetical protein